MRKWLVPNIFAIIIFIILLLLFNNRELPYEGGMFIDAFMLTGFFVIMGSLIIYVDHQGVFNIVTYGFKKVLRMIQRHPAEDFPESYFEYSEIRNSREKIILWPTVVTGIIYLTIGFIIYFILNF